jgi:hypothetical protein
MPDVLQLADDLREDDATPVPGINITDSWLAHLVRGR